MMLSLSNLYDDLENFNNLDKDINESLKEYIKHLKSKCDSDWNSYQTFWPPRMIEALKENKLNCLLYETKSRSVFLFIHYS